MLDQFKQATKNDHSLKILHDHVLNGWPVHKRSSGFVGKKYWQYRNRISIHDDLLFLDDRLIIPVQMQKQILTKLHESHLGLSKTMNLAKTSVFWLGMRNHIEDLIGSCTACKENMSIPQKQPLLQSEVPLYPFQIISSDIFHYQGKNYLMFVDHYSKWFTVDRLQGLHSREVIEKLDGLLSSFGLCEILRSDNATQYTSSEFQEFLRNNNIRHVTSSPAYAQSNGLAERFVQTAKLLVKKCNGDEKQINAGIRQHRNTPISDKLPAPAVLLQGRYLHDGLPRQNKSVIPKSYNYAKVQEDMAEIKSKQKLYYDRKAGEELDVIKPGEHVRVLVNDKWVFGKIQTKCPEPRSYVVITEKGSYRRTRGHIQKTLEAGATSPKIGSGGLGLPSESSHSLGLSTSSVARPIISPANSNLLPPHTSQSSSSSEQTPAHLTVQNRTSDQPYQTRSGRTVTKPDRLHYNKF